MRPHICQKCLKSKLKSNLDIDWFCHHDVRLQNDLFEFVCQFRELNK